MILLDLEHIGIRSRDDDLGQTQSIGRQLEGRQQAGGAVETARPVGRAERTQVIAFVDNLQIADLKIDLLEDSVTSGTHYCFLRAPFLHVVIGSPLPTQRGGIKASL